MPNTRRKPKLIGKDYYGTKYFEIPPGSVRNTPSRYFEPVNENAFDQEVPAEWEAWLRHRRKEPPTQQELEANYKLQLTKKENAAKIAAQHSKDKPDDAVQPAKSKGSLSFPIYEEYKKNGTDYKIKY